MRERDERYMSIAVDLALRGTGAVSPNPRVGCVITTQDGEHIVSTGHHRKYGGPHAEADALARAGSVPDGSVLYVNLEPCSHTGKTPPCAMAIVRSGVRRVVAGMRDPNPLVSGKGFKILEEAGIAVECGVLEQECRKLNRGFIRRMTLGRPWVTVKAATSIDGAMALTNGSSKWITGEAARRAAHIMRSEHDALLIGAGTALNDSPMLDVRDADGPSPIRVVIDPALSVPLTNPAIRSGAIIFCASDADLTDADRYADNGVRVIKVGSEDGEVPIMDVLHELLSLGVNSVMVEGGPRTISRFIRAEAVDQYSIFAAAKLIGQGMRFTDGMSFGTMDDAITLKDVKIRDLEDDILLEGVPICSPAL